MSTLIKPNYELQLVNQAWLLSEYSLHLKIKQLTRRTISSWPSGRAQFISKTFWYLTVYTNSSRSQLPRTQPEVCLNVFVNWYCLYRKQKVQICRPKRRTHNGPARCRRCNNFRSIKCTETGQIFTSPMRREKFETAV